MVKITGNNLEKFNAVVEILKEKNIISEDEIKQKKEKLKNGK